MEETTKLEYLLFAMNSVPNFLMVFVYLIFFKMGFNSVKNLKILLMIVIFFATLTIGSCIWLNLIESEKARSPIFELTALYFVFLIHKMFLIKNTKKINQPIKLVFYFTKTTERCILF